MKMTSIGIIGAGALLLATAMQSPGIEGLQISVQCPDVILGWPSVPGENYIVQWRPTLDPSTPWVTLTNSLPADWTTNWTVFIHSNQVQCASGSSLAASASGGLSDSAAAASQPPVPLAMPADGSGDAVPLSLYPVGSDLSLLIIFDPTTGEWTSGSGYSIKPFSANRPQPDGPQPEDDDPGSSPPPDPGFY